MLNHPTTIWLPVLVLPTILLIRYLMIYIYKLEKINQSIKKVTLRFLCVTISLLLLLPSYLFFFGAERIESDFFSFFDILIFGLALLSGATLLILSVLLQKKAFDKLVLWFISTKEK